MKIPNESEPAVRYGPLKVIRTILRGLAMFVAACFLIGIFLAFLRNLRVAIGPSGPTGRIGTLAYAFSDNTFAVQQATKQVFLTVIVGMVLVWLLISLFRGYFWWPGRIRSRQHG